MCTTLLTIVPMSLYWPYSHVIILGIFPYLSSASFTLDALTHYGTFHSEINSRCTPLSLALHCPLHSIDTCILLIFSLYMLFPSTCPFILPTLLFYLAFSFDWPSHSTGFLIYNPLHVTGPWIACYWSMEYMILALGLHVTGPWIARYWSLDCMLLVLGLHVTGPWIACYWSLDCMLLVLRLHVTGPWIVCYWNLDCMLLVLGLHVTGPWITLFWSLDYMILVLGLHDTGPWITCY